MLVLGLELDELDGAHDVELVVRGLDLLVHQHLAVLRHRDVVDVTHHDVGNPVVTGDGARLETHLDDAHLVILDDTEDPQPDPQPDLPLEFLLELLLRRVDGERAEEGFLRIPPVLPTEQFLDSVGTAAIQPDHHVAVHLFVHGSSYQFNRYVSISIYLRYTKSTHNIIYTILQHFCQVLYSQKTI